MIDTLLHARLKTIAPNVYPNVAPLDYSLPAVVYQLIDTETITDLDGTINDEGYLTFQISVTSDKYAAAKLLARNIRNSVIAWEDPNIQAVAWINEHMMADTTTQHTLHRALLFFKFFCAV